MKQLRITREVLMFIRYGEPVIDPAVAVALLLIPILVLVDLLIIPFRALGR